MICRLRLRRASCRAGAPTECLERSEERDERRKGVAICSIVRAAERPWPHSPGAYDASPSVDVVNISALDELPFFDCSDDIDWSLLLNNDPILALFDTPLIPLDNLASSIQDPPQSPCSDTTFVDSPTPSLGSWADSKSPVDENDMNTHTPHDAVDGFNFSFQCLPSVTSHCLPEPAMLSPTDIHDRDHGQSLSQREIAAAGVHDPLRGVEDNADQSAFSCTTPDVILSSSVPAPPLETPSIVRKPSEKRMKTEGDSSSAAKRPRRRQSTVPKYQCPECELVFARSHNLTVHKSSVHRHERTHACQQPGCTRVFSRKHDLARHHQSMHTNLGSPRNKSACKGASRSKPKPKPEPEAAQDTDEE